MNQCFRFVLCLVVATAACGDDPPAPSAPATPKPAAGAPTPAGDDTPAEGGGSPPGPVAGEEELDAPEVAYAYSPVGKRDPFRSIFEDLVEKSGGADLTELQRYEIDQLKLIAIVTGRAAPYAMVEDPTGKGHTITRGTLMGKNWGRVAGITSPCIQVKEEYRDYTGRKVANQISVCLPKPKDELKLD